MGLQENEALRLVVPPVCRLWTLQKAEHKTDYTLIYGKKVIYKYSFSLLSRSLLVDKGIHEVCFLLQCCNISPGGSAACFSRLLFLPLLLWSCAFEQKKP